MADLLSIRNALRDTIQTNIPSLKVYPVIPENPNTLPCVVVQPTDSDFHMAMGRGTDQQDFILLVLVSYNDLTVAQTNLDPYVSGSGAKSIRECIFNYRNLGVEGWQATISQMFDYGLRFKGEYMGRGHEQLGARLRMTVYTSGAS